MNLKMEKQRRFKKKKGWEVEGRGPCLLLYPHWNEGGRARTSIVNKATIYSFILLTQVLDSTTPQGLCYDRKKTSFFVGDHSTLVFWNVLFVIPLHDLVP